MSNEAEQMTANNSDGSITSHANASPTPPLQIMRIYDASGYEDVILRPKTESKQQKANNRRLARPFAVLSGLFKSHRERNTNQDDTPENVQHERHSDEIKLPKRRSWNIFKSKKKNRDESPLTFQRFQVNQCLLFALSM